MKDDFVLRDPYYGRVVSAGVLLWEHRCGSEELARVAIRVSTFFGLFASCSELDRQSATNVYCSDLERESMEVGIPRYIVVSIKGMRSKVGLGRELNVMGYSHQICSASAQKINDIDVAGRRTCTSFSPNSTRLTISIRSFLSGFELR